MVFKIESKNDKTYKSFLDKIYLHSISFDLRKSYKNLLEFVLKYIRIYILYKYIVQLRTVTRDNDTMLFVIARYNFIYLVNILTLYLLLFKLYLNT